MKAYKGFNEDLTCRGFQFAEGQTYEEPKAVLCETGFHACLEPMDVFAYYHPSNGAVVHEVEVDDDVRPREGGDSKVASRRITIGARIDLMGMIRAHLAIVWDRVEKVRATSPDQYSSGDQSTAATSGNQSTAATSGHQSTAATSGNQSTAATSGHQSTAATSGDQSTAATSGYQSTAATSGNRSTAATSGYRSTAIATGKQSVAVAAGWKSTAAGADTCWLALFERNDDDEIIAAKVVRVGQKSNGVRVEPGVAYMLVDGRVTEAVQA